MHVVLIHPVNRILILVFRKHMQYDVVIALSFLRNAFSYLESKKKLKGEISLRRSFCKLHELPSFSQNLKISGKIFSQICKNLSGKKPRLYYFDVSYVCMGWKTLI